MKIKVKVRCVEYKKCGASCIHKRLHKINDECNSKNYACKVECKQSEVIK